MLKDKVIQLKSTVSIMREEKLTGKAPMGDPRSKGERAAEKPENKANREGSRSKDRTKK